MSLLQELEIISREEGFDSAQAFVTDFILKGHTFGDLTDYLAQRYNLNYSYSNVYGQLRPLCKLPIRGRRYYNAILYHSRKAGYGRIDEFVQAIWHLPLGELAKEFGLKNTALLRRVMEQVRRGLVPVGKRTKRRHRVINREGFRSRAARYRWQKRARELGYRTLREAFYELEHRKGLSSKQIARLFEVTQQAYLLRRKKLFGSHHR